MSNIEFYIMRCGECDIPLGVIPRYLAAYADMALCAGCAIEYHGYVGPMILDRLNWRRGRMKRFQKLKYRYLEKYLQCEVSMELDLSFEQFLMISLEGFEAPFII